MEQQPNDQEGTISVLNETIKALDLAKISRIPSVKAVFDSIRVLLALIRDLTARRPDYVDLGLSCADVCRALDRGMTGKKPGDLSQPVRDAIKQLTVTVEEIQRKLVKWGKRNSISQHFHAKSDKETTTAWVSRLGGIARVFNEELTRNTNTSLSFVRHDVSGVQGGVTNTPSFRSRHIALGNSQDTCGVTHASAPGESPSPPPKNPRGTVPENRHDIVTRTIVSEFERNVMRANAMVSDIRHTVAQGQKGTGGKDLQPQTSALGESPPPPPRTFFGRDELIEKIVGLVETFVPIALIGAGGIGKTSLALAALHHDRIKQRFGQDRRFIRCDQFPASRPQLLRRLSTAIGLGVENPEDLAPLRALLSSKPMLVILDNAESILDPQGVDAQEIYAAVEELSRFNNICICVTSRISAIPADFKHLGVPTLSMDAACHTFYRIYDNCDRSSLVDGVLEQLDFHPLSVTLLATVAHQNQWDTNRLVREWGRRRTSVLHTQHNKSLAATIELSLSSPMFQDLGPNGRTLLEVVAFFPQGVDENNLDWLFPTISNGIDIFDKFCVLSLTYRSDGFITMLAPLRDYLSPKDPASSPLLCATKERYFARLSVDVDPNKPNFGKTRWIVSEDVNIEHLLNVFTTADSSSGTAWDACFYFMQHLYWHRKRLVTLKPKVEALPDDHSSKLKCLFELSRLSHSVGNQAERKRLLTRALKLKKENGDDLEASRILRHLSGANRLMGLPKEGIQQAKAALEILERLGGSVQQARCLIDLAVLYRSDEQFAAAEEAASRAICLIPEEDEQFLVSESHRILGDIYLSKGEKQQAIRHFKMALEIATPFNWHNLLFWVHHSLAELFRDEGTFDDACGHVEHAKSHAVNSAYNLGRAIELQAMISCKQRRFEEARSEIMRAADVFENLGAGKDVERCKVYLQGIQEELIVSVSSD